MNPVLQRIVETGQAEAPDGSTVEVHSHVSPAVGRFLQEIVTELKPRHTVEVGLAYGVSALYICEALTAVGGERHTAIDPCQAGWRQVGLSNLRRAGYGELVEFLALPSHLALAQLEVRGYRPGFAFVDGYHTFDHTLCEFFMIDRILEVGGVVVFDDPSWPAVRAVVRFALLNRAYRVHRTLPAARARPRAAARLLKVLSQRSASVRRVLRPEFSTPDVELGSAPGLTCVALVKEAEDSRRWDHYVAF